VTQHKATPEQWNYQEQAEFECDATADCLLELRDRIAALEAQRETEKACIQEIYEKLDRLKVQHESNWSRIVKLEEAHQQPEPIDEEENNRRFLACLAAIDNATPEQVRAAVANASADHSVEVPKMALAPAGGLVRKVAWRVAAFASEAKAGDDATPTARAAVLAVAEWLEQRGPLTAARWLREEVER
jgi:creatinine amidohydrolase/Fe(II)-dependent formamide hydrolase-like protein